jgi:hypothetical protein
MVNGSVLACDRRMPLTRTSALGIVYVTRPRQFICQSSSTRHALTLVGADELGQRCPDVERHVNREARQDLLRTATPNCQSNGQLPYSLELYANDIR